MIKGDLIKLVKPMGVFRNIGEICEVTGIQEGGVICFRFGGCNLGCMSYDEYEKYFVSVGAKDIKVKREWTEWTWGDVDIHDLHGLKVKLTYKYRNNGKKVQCRFGHIKSEACCCDKDSFDFHKGLALAEKRLIIKYLQAQLNDIILRM